MEWKQLQQYHRNPPTVGLGRDVITLLKYNQFIDYLNKFNISIYDYIYDKYFKHNFKLYTIDINKYPYKLKDYIHHYILWIRPSYYISEYIYSKIISHHFSNMSYIYFENNTNNKSIPEIQHIHIFYLQV